MFSCCLPVGRGRGLRRPHGDSLLRRCRRWLSSCPQNLWPCTRRTHRTSTRKRGPELDDYDFYTIPVTTRPVDHSNSSAQRRLQGDENIGMDVEERRTVKNLQRASCGKRTENHQVPLQMHREPCVLANILGNGGYITRHQQVLDQMATSVKRTLHGTWNPNQARLNTGPVNIFQRASWGKRTGDLQVPLQMHREPCVLANILGNGGYITRHQQVLDQMATSVKMTLLTTWRSQTWFRPSTGPVGLEPELYLMTTTSIFVLLLLKTIGQGNMGTSFPPEHNMHQLVSSVKGTLHGTCSPNQVRPNPAPGGGQPEQCLESVNLSSPSTLLGNQQRVYVFLFIIFFLVFSIFLFK
ncbi:uncharacterized protein LOC143648094 isoform X2 [Tamandua tetradactyla]|uniref:uncharacterized protein LOC143648094 isoform X2 n=1 Tax=Tamandua tetradactyla TaxID=48850 RepID=UPI0040546922